MNNLELPYWLLVVLEISKGLVTPVIAVFGIWIARNQLEVNRQKLKLDLFEKRYAVYECIRKMLCENSQRWRCGIRYSARL